MEEVKKREKPEAIVLLERVWPDLDEKKRLKLKCLAEVLSFMVEDEKKESA